MHGEKSVIYIRGNSGIAQKFARAKITTLTVHQNEDFHSLRPTYIFGFEKVEIFQNPTAITRTSDLFTYLAYLYLF